MRAVKGLQNGKAPVIDSITAELLKADMAFSAKRRGKTVLSVLRKVLCRFIIIYYYNYRIISGVDVMLRKEQAGYRKGRADERTGIYTAGRD